MGAKSPPMGRPAVGGEGAPPPSLWRAGGGEGEEEWDSEFPRNSGFLPMWKNKRQELKDFLLVIHGES